MDNENLSQKEETLESGILLIKLSCLFIKMIIYMIVA
jgi:hypothetical protein